MAHIQLHMEVRIEDSKVGVAVEALGKALASVGIEDEQAVVLQQIDETTTAAQQKA